MKGKLAGLAAAAIAASALLLGGCVAEAGDDAEDVAAPSSTVAPGKGPGTVGVHMQDIPTGMDPVPNPWQGPNSIPLLTPKHGPAPVGEPGDSDSDTSDDLPAGESPSVSPSRN
jgi:hypothetical protein